MARRPALAGAILVAVLLAVGLGLALWPDTGPDVTPAPTPAPRPAVPEPPPPAPPLAANTRVQVRPPPGVEPPQMPDERPEPAPITPDDRRTMNYAMDDVIKNARAECLDDWITEEGAPTELVFDGVLYDGRLVDFGMRSLGPQVPESVVECVADAVWYGDWPEWDLRGELRLQRSIEVQPQ